MPIRRNNRPPPDLGHTPTADLGPYRKLVEGDEAKVLLPERSTRIRMKFMWTDNNGDLTFADSRGSTRTVHPDAVGTIHRRSPKRLDRKATA